MSFRSKRASMRCVAPALRIGRRRSEEAQVATRELVEPQAEAIDRFRQDLDALIDPNAPVGLAVSGGPDSLALLALAAAARPGFVEAATVDHALRSEAAAEAEMVAKVAKTLGVPHRTLKVEWARKPDRKSVV